MKTFFSVLILMIGLLLSIPPGNELQAANSPDQSAFVVNNQITTPAALVQEEGGVQVEPEQTNIEPAPEPVEAGNFFSDNWGALVLGLLGFFDLVARLTPSDRDNSIINFLMSLFNTLIPNLKKGGGSFKLLSK